jgi:hypothetical protein
MTDRIDAEDSSKPGSFEIKREDTVEPVSIYCATTLRITRCARSERDVIEDDEGFGSNVVIKAMYGALSDRSTVPTSWPLRLVFQRAPAPKP